MKYREHLFEFAAERQRLADALRDDGDMDTADPVLQGLGFGYIIREEDGLTRWFNHQIRSKIHEPDSALLACVAFRFFNSVHAASLLRPWLLRERPWNEKQILLEIQATGKSFPHAAQRLVLIRPFLTLHLGAEAEDHSWSLRRMHQSLLTYIRPATAYEIVEDLRHTCVLDQADDKNTWAYVSPQVCAGMGYLISDCPAEFIFGHERTEHGMLLLMRELLEEAWDRDLPWEMSEVESALHEFHRYRVAQTLGPFK